MAGKVQDSGYFADILIKYLMLSDIYNKQVGNLIRLGSQLINQQYLSEKVVENITNTNKPWSDVFHNERQFLSKKTQQTNAEIMASQNC